MCTCCKRESIARRYHSRPVDRLSGNLVGAKPRGPARREEDISGIDVATDDVSRVRHVVNIGNIAV
jgi:hypothetical protein